MKRTLIAATSLLALAACQREPDNEVDPGAGTPTAEDAASEASASAGGAGSGAAGGSVASGSASAPEAGGRAIGAPPPINGSDGAAPAGAGGAVRPEMGSRPPEDPTTGTLVRPESPMPQTTPDGRPAL